MSDVQLDPDDAKIITLARSARVRRATACGAAVRDAEGRTYAASDVNLASVTLSALQLAVAMAASSGAERLEAGAVVTAEEPGSVDIAAVRDLGGPGVPVHLAGADGTHHTTLRS